MAYAKPSGEALPVLQNIDIRLRDGEILGLLGRSGSGKSTLPHIAGGLIKPTSGEVIYHGAPLCGPAEGIAVVFQTFALIWLTVQENVELGLDALDLPAAETHRRAASAIDLIGLDGLQSAYPRELSGGMRQRVGFARAIVSDPLLLLMDEPFSALDVLTAETLRTDFLDLWAEHVLPTRAVLMVTHNIEEAVLMCDRILVLGTGPGHIAADIMVPLPQPRDRQDGAFHDIVDEIYSILTSRMEQAIGKQKQMPGGYIPLLPSMSVNRLSGFLENPVRSRLRRARGACAHRGPARPARQQSAADCRRSAHPRLRGAQGRRGDPHRGGTCLCQEHDGRAQTPLQGAPAALRSLRRAYPPGTRGAREPHRTARAIRGRA